MKKQIREIRVIDIVTHAILSPLAIIALWLACCLVIVPGLDSLSWIAYVVAAVLTYMLLRKTLIGCVLLYKAYAPLEMRGRCRFIPTCSTYMIMAIKKYGIIIGVTKGIRRIRRCKPPNGGEDYP